MSAERLWFGPVQFDAVLGRLSKDGRTVAISQRAIDLLRALVSAAGRTVSRAELIETAWPDLIVEEGNLTVQVAALRKALGQGPDDNEWIVTVPRVGYRLSLLPGEDASAVSAPPVLPSLAVLPFETIGGDRDEEVFADGVVEDIITALSFFRTFAVIARNSTFALKGKAINVKRVAADLGVRYVLEGSVRRADTKLRLSARLIDAEAGTEIWSQHFDGAVDDVFSFQDQLTESVVGRVAPQILKAEVESARRRRPDSIAAYDLYIRANAKIYMGSDRDNAEAYGLLTRALQIEPDNAMLLSLAAETLCQRLTRSWSPFGSDDREKCIDFALRGLHRAAGDANVLANCGCALLHVGKEYDLALAIARQAASANPNNFLAIFFAGLVQLHCESVDAAQGYFERAIRLSPHDLNLHAPLSGIAHCQMIKGGYREALDWAERSRVHAPHYVCNMWILVAANTHLGNLAEARRHLDSLTGISPDASITCIRDGQPGKDPTRIAAILDGLRMAGLSE